VKVWVVFFFVRFRLGIHWYFGIWVFFNGLNAFLDAPGIAWFGHVGGFVAGVAVAYAGRNKLRMDRGIVARAYMSTSWHHRTKDVSFRTCERQIENLEDIERAHIVSVVLSKDGVLHFFR
jgi:hypothetical protein